MLLLFEILRLYEIYLTVNFWAFYLLKKNKIICTSKAKWAIFDFIWYSVVWKITRKRIMSLNSDPLKASQVGNGLWEVKITQED